MTATDVDAEPVATGLGSKRVGARRLAIPRAAVTAIVGFAAIVVISIISWRGNDVTFATVSVTLISGVALGSIYAMSASGLVVTYTTTGVFNFAQGAIGMFMAFVFWEFTINQGMATLPAVLLTVLVVAPLFGVLLEVLLMRRLVEASLVAQLVVTIAMMFFLIGLATTLWDQNTPRSLPFWFGLSGFHIGDTLVLWHRAIAIGIAMGVALGLRVLLHHSRMGVTMRAVVDNRGLAALHGARPERISMLAWALSSSLAALAGILVAPEIGVEPLSLTLLTISAFAAAIVGRLRSLPWTFAGAMVLGILYTYATGFLDLSGRWFQLPLAIPSLMLLVALLALPQSRLQFAKIGARGQFRARRISTVPEATLGLGVLFVIVLVVSAGMGQVDLNHLTMMVVIGTLLLSFVPLTGWAGQVSLAQITFAGVGAFTMWKVAGSTGNPLGLLAAALVAVPFGFLMALPALRLQGLYLALSSLAFALLGEYLLFGQTEVFGASGRTLTRPDFLGIDFRNQRTFLIGAMVIFVALGLAVVWMRRGRFGRRLVALRDSEAASATLGVNPIVTKLAVYGLSAAMAGLAGALYALNQTSAVTTDYTFLVGVPLLLLVVAGGVQYMSGAVFGGIVFVLFTLLQQWLGWSILDSLERLGPAGLALGIAQNPDGAVVAIGEGFAPLLPWRKDARERVALMRAQKKEAKAARAGKAGSPPMLAGVSSTPLPTSTEPPAAVTGTSERS